MYVHIQPPWLYSIQSLFFSSQAPPFFWKFPFTEMGSLMTPDLGAKSTPGTVPGVDLAPTSGVKSVPRKFNEILFQQSIFRIKNLPLVGYAKFLHSILAFACALVCSRIREGADLGFLSLPAWCQVWGLSGPLWGSVGFCGPLFGPVGQKCE